MRLFGKEMSEKEVNDRIGDLSQLGGIKSYEYNDGFSRGMRAFDIRTSSGVEMTVLADRCMDISHLSYHAAPLCWRSAVPQTHPSYFESRWDEWLRNFYGGFLTTCGFTYFGFPCRDGDIEYNIHGRASNLPAYHVCQDVFWEKDTCCLTLTGKMREAKHGGDRIEITRKISAWMDRPTFLLEDQVKNIGNKKSPLMVLYHFNLGYPLIDEGAQILEGPAKVVPFDDLSAKNFENFSTFSGPSPLHDNELYFHTIEADSQGYGNIAVIHEGFNQQQGLGIWLKYKKDTLPCLTEWKFLRNAGEYVCGIEPGTNFVSNIVQEKKNQTLQFLGPGEKRTFQLEISVLRNQQEIKDVKNALKR